MKNSGTVLLIISAFLDFAFSRVDELFKSRSPEPQFWVYDFASFYRVGCLMLLILFFAKCIAFEKKININRIVLLLYVLYIGYAIVTFFLWTQTQYNARFPGTN